MVFWSKAPKLTKYTILSTDNDLITVMYDFPNGKSYQHTLRCDLTDGPGTLSAIETAGREFAPLFPDTAPTDTAAAPEVVALIDVPTEIPAEAP